VLSTLDGTETVAREIGHRLVTTTPACPAPDLEHT
jgi:hypothetical protein